MKRFVLFTCVLIMISCQNVVDENRAIELQCYLSTLELAANDMQLQMQVERDQFANEIENNGVPNDPVLTQMDNNLRKSFEFSRYISELKQKIIDENGGYSMDNNLPVGWYKNLELKAYLPSEELDSLQTISDNVLMVLIEITNKSIAFTYKMNKLNQALIDEKRQPEKSVLFLAESVQEPHQSIEGPLFYSFDYYPIDSLQINGKWYFGDEYVEIPLEEWDMLAKKDLKINLPLKLYWGDTTFQFSSKKR